MTGDEVFERLSSMTEERRKECLFIFASEEKTIKNFLHDIIFNEKDFIKEEILEEAAEKISSDDVKNVLKKVEVNISDEAFNYYFDEFNGLLYDELRNKMNEKLKDKNIQLIEE
jgi:hypothetical protein